MEKPAQEIKQIRPWVRYWARTFDIYLLITIIGYPFGYLIGSTFPSFVNDVLAEFVFALILVFIWVFIESFLLITWGTTPGKWLLNVTITSPTGETLFFFEAIYRSFSVWWRGLAIGFPIVSLFTLINAHGKLKREGLTSWDRDGGFVVSHKKIGVARVIVFLLIFIILGFFAKFMSEQHKINPNKPYMESEDSSRSFSAEEWFDKAKALWQNWQYTDPKKAIEYLSKGIRLKPDYASAYWNRAMAYDQLGQHQRAFEDYNQVIRLKPNDADGYTGRGVAYLNMGNITLGCSDVQKACSMGVCEAYEVAKKEGKCR